MKYLALHFLIFAAVAFAQTDDFYKAMNQPHEPFRIIGNVYYVGASDVTSFLVTSNRGHILLDGGFAETAPMILANIKTLGFNPKDVKFLLNSQAHFDHAGGFAEIKKATGARMIASKEDGRQLERGGKGDYYFGDKYTFSPVQIDRFIDDKETVSVGNVVMKAVLTRGHTKGCTSWTIEVQEDNRAFEVVFLCGLSILPGVNLVKNENYPDIAKDLRKSYQTLKSLPCDIFLGAHGSYFGLKKKDALRKAGSKTNPFIGSGELRKHVEEKETEFRSLLSGQK